jgi:hypothetical protein
VPRVQFVPGRRRWVSFTCCEAAGEVPGFGLSLAVKQSGVSLRVRRRYCSDEAVVEECEVVVWCVGGKLGEVGDQELRGVCFGGGGVLLRRFPGRLLPKPAEPGSARSGHSRGLANHRAPEYSYHLPATSLHLLSFSFPKKPYLPPEVRSTAHQPSSNFATISFCSAAIDTVKKPICRRGPRFSRKELQIGVARYASTKPHACMHAYCTVQVRYTALTTCVWNVSDAWKYHLLLY